MQLTVNGKPLPLEPGSNIAALLAELGLTEKRVAVEVNGRIVPRSEHGEHRLADNDTVEVVQAIGGG